MELVSVIVPVYNAEKSLSDCLNSIIQQTYQNIEIILVDDGSIDGSLDICNDYARRDLRIRVYSMEHQGPAPTRKHGVKMARGERVTFVDADDLLEKELIEQLIDGEVLPEIDLVTSGYMDEETGNKIFDNIPKGIYVSEEDKRIIFSQIMINDVQPDSVLPYQWGKLFRKDLALEVYDAVDVQIWIGEDREFTRRYLLKCRGIHITDICAYRKGYGENTLSRSKRDLFLINVIRNYVSLKEVFGAHKEKVLLMKSLNRWIFDLVMQDMKRWGILQDVGFVNYIFPFYPEIFQKKFVLYGAGEVGQSYFYQLSRMGEIPVLWVDNKYMVYRKLHKDVKAVAELDTIAYDYIIVAVAHEITAEEIKAELIGKGIDERTILWKKPIPVAMVTR